MNVLYNYFLIVPLFLHLLHPANSYAFFLVFHSSYAVLLVWLFLNLYPNLLRKEENIPVLTAEHIIIEDDAKEEAPISPTLSPLEELLQADVEDLLKTIERPDSTQPLFKQLYGLYGIELRSLYRHKELPPNLSLEDTLQKANSMLRFEVK